MRHRLEPLGIGPRQARILDALSRMGSTSQVELAREFTVTAASMSTMTTRLVKAGLIARGLDPDSARSNRLSLTAEGDRMLDAIDAAWRETDEAIVEAIGAEKAAALAALTTELRDALGGHVPGTKPKKGG